MKATENLNRKELQTKINNLYIKYKYCFSTSIPNGEIELLLNRRTRNLVLTYESMLEDVKKSLLVK